MKRQRLFAVLPVPSLALSLALSAALLATPAAFAHDGVEHAHDDAGDSRAAPAEAAADIGSAHAPRIAFGTAQVEVLIVREPRQLVIYVDDYATNAPLTGLQLSLQRGAEIVAATPAADGSYRVTDDQLGIAATDPLPVRLRLHGEGLDEDLRGELPPAAAEGEAENAAAHAASSRTWLNAGAAGLLGIGLLAGLVLRLRRRR